MIQYPINHTPPRLSVKLRRTSKRKQLGLPSYESREYEASCRRWQKYGLPELAFNSMMDGQGFACDICKQVDEDETGKAVTLHVDHCHKNGWVRGLLCVRCNVILGRVKDDPSILQAAAAYLRFHNREGKLSVASADPDTK